MPAIGRNENMFGFIKRFINKPEPGLPINWRDLEDHDKFPWLMKEGCLVCLDNPDFEVTMGPCGGISQNVWCTKCGTRWNMTVFSQTQGLGELIDERERDPRRVLKVTVAIIELER